jgi:hypothetical protein
MFQKTEPVAKAGSEHGFSKHAGFRVKSSRYRTVADVKNRLEAQAVSVPFHSNSFLGGGNIHN